MPRCVVARAISGSTDHRIEQAGLPATAEIVGIAAAVEIGHPQPVGEERGVEPRRLQRAGQMLVALGLPDVAAAAPPDAARRGA